MPPTLSFWFPILPDPGITVRLSLKPPTLACHLLSHSGSLYCPTHALHWRHLQLKKTHAGQIRGSGVCLNLYNNPKHSNSFSGGELCMRSAAAPTTFLGLRFLRLTGFRALLLQSITFLAQRSNLLTLPRHRLHHRAEEGNTDVTTSIHRVEEKKHMRLIRTRTYAAVSCPASFQRACASHLRLPVPSPVVVETMALE